MGVRYKLIRMRVEQLLAHHGIKQAPVDIERLARGLGAEVIRKPAEDNLSGFILRDQGRVVIGVNSEHPKTRQRFTLAHEIGHLLLHEGEPLHVDSDTPGFSVNRRDQRSREGSDVTEREANHFAAELLMPATFLEQDIGNAESVDLLDTKETILDDIAKKYGVSVKALTFRLANLGLIHL